jgi:hypothetical protein
MIAAHACDKRRNRQKARQSCSAHLDRVHGGAVQLHGRGDGALALLRHHRAERRRHVGEVVGLVQLVAQPPQERQVRYSTFHRRQT